MATESAHELSRDSSLLSQWMGVLLAPSAWFVQLQTSYLLVFYACSSRNHFTLHLATLLFLLLSAAGGFIAWSNWRRAGRKWPDEHATPASRTRFMAVLGLLTSALFFLLILTQGIPSFFLEPCIK